MNEKVVALIDQEDWTSTAPRLVKFAHHEICKYYWRGYRPAFNESGIPNANGMSPSDFLSIAIRDLANETRSYREDLSLEKNLRGIIRSNIYNSWKKQKNQPPYAQSLVNNQDGTKRDPLEEVHSPDQVDDLELNRVHQEQNRVLDAFAEFLEGDDDLGILFLCMREGIEKNAVIEEMYGIPATRVSELKRKLERKQKKFLSIYPNIRQQPLERTPQ